MKLFQALKEKDNAIRQYEELQSRNQTKKSKKKK